MDNKTKLVIMELINQFIKDGQPVSSKTLSPRLNMSSASVRQILAHLEDKQFIKKLHTSSGRVPTEKGYRLLLDGLKIVSPSISIDDVGLEHDGAGRLSEYIEVILSLFSKRLSYALIGVTLFNKLSLSNVEFFKINNHYGVLILFFSNGLIQEVSMKFNLSLNDVALDRAMEFIKSNCQSQTWTINPFDMTIMSQQFVAEIIDQLTKENDRRNFSMLISKNIEKCCQLCDFSTKESIQNFLSFFSNQDNLNALMARYLDSESIAINIESELKLKPLNQCSLITVPVHLNQRLVGGIGIFGPSRMNYKSVLNLISTTNMLAMPN